MGLLHNCTGLCIQKEDRDILVKCETFLPRGVKLHNALKSSKLQDKEVGAGAEIRVVKTESRGE